MRGSTTIGAVLLRTQLYCISPPSNNFPHVEALMISPPMQRALQPLTALPLFKPTETPPVDGAQLNLPSTRLCIPWGFAPHVMPSAGNLATSLHLLPTTDSTPIATCKCPPFPSTICASHNSDTKHLALR
ncbi:hypothetical protein KP509_24G069000 [Ceratopteris richardii]|uniref:Uncharacterized protein n=1 Tax=Ceratopteris richardii TaxID=49495 RepID=A0A8T2RW19_CERRI|nr:hypothetical protein KP509_24G069000 [Ceratopteris richardii]